MLNDNVIDDLVASLKPIRPRRRLRDVLLFASAGILEVVLFAGFGATRSDLLMAMALPSFWWKVLSLGLLALVGGVVAVRAFVPENSPRRGLRWLAALLGASLAIGWTLGATPAGRQNLIDRLNWHQGIECMLTMGILALPAIIGLGILMRRGAPTDRQGASIAVGLAGAAWGAFVFALHCPHDDPLYVAVWYAAGCSTVVLLARFVLPLMTRW
jgi:hypothetical protein